MVRQGREFVHARRATCDGCKIEPASGAARHRSVRHGLDAIHAAQPAWQQAAAACARSIGLMRLWMPQQPRRELLLVALQRLLVQIEDAQGTTAAAAVAGLRRGRRLRARVA